MSLTITLITPPDIFENDSPGIFLVNLTETQQDEATKWLADCKLDIDLNIYFSQNESNAVWFLHAMASSSHKYINLDNTNGMTSLLSGYILGKPSVYYSTEDKNKIAILSHINQNRVNSVKDFFERVLSEDSQ
jgi:hypothetical protein